MLPSNRGFEEWGEIFGDERLWPPTCSIDCSITATWSRSGATVTRGSTFELWQILHAPSDPEPAAPRRRVRQELPTNCGSLPPICQILSPISQGSRCFDEYAGHALILRVFYLPPRLTATVPGGFRKLARTLQGAGVGCRADDRCFGRSAYACRVGPRSSRFDGHVYATGAERRVSGRATLFYLCELCARCTAMRISPTRAEDSLNIVDTWPTAKLMRMSGNLDHSLPAALTTFAARQTLICEH